MFRGIRRARQKYAAKRTEVAGRSFASKLEAAVYDMLLLLKKAGEVSEIRCQTQVALSRAKIIYKPDFEVTRTDGSRYWVEAKGFETPEWRIKRRLWLAYGPGTLEIWKGRPTHLVLSETLMPEEL